MWYKDINDHEYMDKRHLSFELLKSIRELDIRINELGLLIKNRYDWYKDQRDIIVQRIEKLIETRFNLVYTFMDLNGQKSASKKSSTNPFDYMHTDYSLLKRQIGKQYA